jgi:hypothetical protein
MDDPHGGGVAGTGVVGGEANASAARVTPFNAYEQHEHEQQQQQFGVDMRQQHPHPDAWHPGPSFGFAPMVIPTPTPSSPTYPTRQNSTLSGSSASSIPPAGIGAYPHPHQTPASTTSCSSYSQPSTSDVVYGKEQEAYAGRRVTNASVASTEEGRGQEVVVPSWGVPGSSSHARSLSGMTESKTVGSPVSARSRRSEVVNKGAREREGVEMVEIPPTYDSIANAGRA